MKNFLIAFLIFLIWSVFGLWMYSVAASPINSDDSASKNISEIKKVSKDSIITSEISDIEPITIKKNLVIKSLDKELLFESDFTIFVLKDSTQVQLPYELQDLPALLTSYLFDHSGQELLITSKYAATANHENPNLGEQRGRDFKNQLIAAGADKNQLVVKPVIITTGFDDTNVLENGITLTFKLLDRERIANFKKEIPDVITFYPTYNFDEVIANNKLTKLSEDIKLLSEEYPDLMINVIGHTDHIGAASENYIRGLKSSRQIRWFLINRAGIERDKVKATSKGEHEPILREGRPASRAENARIEIIFSEKE